MSWIEIILSRGESTNNERHSVYLDNVLQVLFDPDVLRFDHFQLFQCVAMVFVDLSEGETRLDEFAGSCGTWRQRVDLIIGKMTYK